MFNPLDDCYLVVDKVINNLEKIFPQNLTVHNFNFAVENYIDVDHHIDCHVNK